MMRIASQKIVQVDWVDSSVLTGWQTREEIENLKDSLIHSIGFLVSLTKDAVTVSASYSTETHKFADAMTIPRKAILKIQYL